MPRKKHVAVWLCELLYSCQGGWVCGILTADDEECRKGVCFSRHVCVGLNRAPLVREVEGERRARASRGAARWCLRIVRGTAISTATRDHQALRSKWRQLPRFSASNNCTGNSKTLLGEIIRLRFFR